MLRHTLLGLSLVSLLVGTAACSSDPDPEPCEGAGCDERDTSTDDDSGSEVDTSEDVIVGAECTSHDDCDPGWVCDPGLERCTPACATDADCGPREVCEVSSGVCLQGTLCEEASECGAGQTCDTCDGVCRASTGGMACQQDNNCGFDQYCDPCLHECRDSSGLCGACFEDYQCGTALDLCVPFASGGNYCGQQCGDGIAPCPLGYVCNSDVEQCVPNSGQCSAIIACTSDVECTGVQICSPTGQCVDGCSDDEACAGADVCSGGRCVAPCASDADCEGEEVCDETGHCGIPGGCVTSHDCLVPETYCDREQGMCVDGCQEDVDCLDAAMECVGGGCELKGCRGNYSCAFGQVCELESGACGPPDGPFCETCDGDDLHSCGDANLCLTLEDEDGNEQGDFCMVACSDDPDNLCPQGYGCRELDVDGTIYPVCVRACYVEPV